jgi:hypothetical protein
MGRPGPFILGAGGAPRGRNCASWMKFGTGVTNFPNKIALGSENDLVNITRAHKISGASMNHTVNGALNNDPVLRPRVERAIQLLKEIIGPTFDSVVIRWGTTQDASGHPLVSLQLSDFTGASGDLKFSPDELANQEHVRARLYRVWGDVLQSRSHRQLNQLSGKI